ncbi:DUF4175 family protein, partial [Rhizobium ruizarguesonis]
LDIPRRNARDAKAVTSRNLTEHPLAGKRVRITLVAKDSAGQTGRSPPHDMTLPSRPFNNRSRYRRSISCGGLLQSFS